MRFHFFLGGGALGGDLKRFFSFFHSMHILPEHIFPILKYRSNKYLRMVKFQICYQISESFVLFINREFNKI